jgi:uncharacterized protein (TIGR03437 family)
VNRLPEILSVFALAAGVCVAQPVLRSTDPVVNGASYANTIAPGSIFVVFGTNLAGDAVVLAPSLPLQATPLGGVSIRFTSVGDSSTVDALMVYTTKNQVAGLLPSSTAPGDYDVRVTYNGQTSAPGRVKVVERSFGIVSADSSGSGQAQAQDYRSATEWDLNRYAKGMLANLTTSPAGPGHVIVLWGTGLGADLASDSGGTSGDRTASAQVKVIVGSKEITPAYAGRARDLPGTDQINFTLPPDTETGCSVPVQVRAGATVSNTVTLAIVPGSQDVCQHPFLSAEVLRRLSAGGNTVLGSFALTKQTVSISFAGLSLDTSIEAVGGSFARYGVGNLSQFGVSPSQLGACQVFQLHGSENDLLLGLTSAPVAAVALDAGNQLTLNGPNANGIAVPRGEKNSYSKTLVEPSLPGLPGGGGGSAVIAAGTYTLAGTGGTDIGAFNAEVTVPATIEWANSKDISTVIRSQPLNVTWTGAASGVVTITGVSASTADASSANPIYDGSIFVCYANGSAGSFSVPSSILSQLPPATLTTTLTSLTSVGLLGIQLSSPASSGTFSAPLTVGGSIDYGSFGFSVGVNKTVDYQ